MADYVNAKFNSETHLAPGELLSINGENYAVILTMGVPAYREVQRSLREANKCACVGCTIATWQQAQAQIAKLANQDRIANAEYARGKV